MRISRFNEYQSRTRDTAIYPERHASTYTSLGLASEAGEVAGTIKKYLRGDFDQEELVSRLAAELGDVLWYLARIADEHNIWLDDIANNNLEKLSQRMTNNTIRGDGDDR
jgi:NTP pyrophosphatase (non-canonical NTP hydrolase)